MIFRPFLAILTIDVVSLQVAKLIVLQLVSLQIAQLFYCFASGSETILKSPFHAFPRYNFYGFAAPRSVAKLIPESMLSLITAIPYAIVLREGMEGRF